MRLATALIGVPSSSSCRSRAGLPVSSTREMLPLRVLISARAASACRVPWSMVTPPESTVGVLSSSVPCCMPDSISMALDRSDLRASTTGLASTARATSSDVRVTLGGMLWDIAGGDLGLERVLLAGQAHFETDAAEYRAGPVNGDRHGRGHAVGFGEYVQLLGAHHDRRAGTAIAFGLDRVAQPQFVAVGTYPAVLGGNLPGIARTLARRDQEQRGDDLHGFVRGIALQLGRAQGERLAAVRIQRDHFEVVKHVVRAATGGDGPLDLLLAVRPQRPATGQCNDQQDGRHDRPPAHAVPSTRMPSTRVTSSSSASTRPCAASSRSQNSRTAPSPAEAEVRQRTRSRTQGCALAGAADRPTCSITRRSGKSSPMKATSSIEIPRRSAISPTRASLSLTAVCTSVMPSSAARCSAMVLARAVMKATSMPALRSSTMPSPSCTWNALSSRPSVSNSSRPSVSVPSTSKHARRTRAARSRTGAG